MWSATSPSSPSSCACCWRRGPPLALWLLCAGAVCLIVPDLVWAVALVAPSAEFGFWADFGWAVFPLFAGLAALHPSMARLGRR